MKKKVKSKPNLKALEKHARASKLRIDSMVMPRDVFDDIQNLRISRLEDGMAALQHLLQTILAKSKVERRKK